MSRFSVAKSTALAKKIISNCGTDNALSMIKLIKLMYLCERTAYGAYRGFITNDILVSMSYGPVLSKTYDLMRDSFFDADSSAADRLNSQKFWNIHFEKRKHNIIDKKVSHVHRLNEAELLIVDMVSEQYGNTDPFDLVDILHKICTEWKKTESSVEISLQDLEHALQPIDQNIFA